MRITFVITCFTGGGAERYLIRLANYLVREKKYKISILNLSYPPETKLEDLLDKEIKYIKLPYLKPKILKEIIFSFLLKRHIKSFKPDIINSHLYDADKLVAFSKLKLPFVITEHGDYRFPHLTHKKEILQSADCIICCSDFSKNYLSLIGDLNIKRIYSGYEKRHFIKITRQELGIPENAFVFCMAARGIIEKWWLEALTAFKKIKYHEGSVFLAIGSGSALSDCISYCKKENLKNIHFLGFQVIPEKFLQISDVFLLPSYSESLPLSLIEALFENLPCVASDTGGIPEILKNPRGDAGILCKMNKAGKPDLD